MHTNALTFQCVECVRVCVCVCVPGVFQYTCIAHLVVYLNGISMEACDSLYYWNEIYCKMHTQSRINYITIILQDRTGTCNAVVRGRYEICKGDKGSDTGTPITRHEQMFWV